MENVNSGFTFLGLDMSWAVLALGAITGMTYGLLAVGLVLVYRTNRVINFAHGEIGAFGAALAGLMVVNWSVPYWIALLAAIATSALVGAGTEVVVVRRLRNAPKLMSFVATLGVAQFLLLFTAAANAEALSGLFPQPPGLPEFRIGALLVTRAYSATLLISPWIVVGLVLFMRRSRFGLALRAAAANPDRARMVGISAGRMSTIAWALAGALAAFTAAMIIPARGFVTAETLGPVLLLRALAPAVIARMTSLPIALTAGIFIGLVDQILTFNYPTSGFSEVVLLVIVVVALLLQSQRRGRLQEREDFAALQPWQPLPEEFARVWIIRNIGRLTAGICLLGAVAVGLVITNATAVTLIAIVVFSLLGLSLGVVTGLGGQLSLGQFALAGVGATVSYAITSRYGDNSFVVSMVLAACATAALSVLVGVPALRVRGLLLGVVTLSFALAAQRWGLKQSWALGDGARPERPHIGPWSLDPTRKYYYWALGVFALGFWLARNVWRGAIGLRLRAVRDNEDSARAFGVSATAVKMQAFAISGLLAGLAGTVYGHLLSRINADSFDVVTSVNVVALTALGGIGLLAGPILGAVYIIGLPRFLPLDSAGLAATSLGWLLLILYFPGGIAQLVGVPRRRILLWLARRHDLDVDNIEAGDPTQQLAISNHTVQFSDLRALQGKASHRPQGKDDTLLEAYGLTKRFGGLQAVGGVDLHLEPGEILGLMGPNGAGKTTLFELLSGFTAPDSGRVILAGKDVTHISPEGRARSGLIRSFQDASLFQTFTVLETITLAVDHHNPTSTILSAAGFHSRLNANKKSAREIVGYMGLDRFRNKQVRELSTGTRRITELACVLALKPTVLLLDEPSSGIAQSETEALGELLANLCKHLGYSLVIIEHDMPLLLNLATRVMAMDVGCVVAEGSPEEIRHNPVVIDCYLGTSVAINLPTTDLHALELSGQINASESPRRLNATDAAPPTPSQAVGSGDFDTTEDW